MAEGNPDAPDPKDAPEPKSDDLGEAGKRALENERRARREAEKKAGDLQKQLDDLDSSTKSDTQKLTDQIGKLQGDLEGERRARWIAEVASDKKLTAAHAKRLSGASKEELEACADELLADFPLPPAKGDSQEADGTSQQQGAGPPGGKPREQLKPGSGDPDKPAENLDIKALGKSMFEGT